MVLRTSTHIKMNILFVTESCYLDDSNGAAVASRSLMETLANRNHRIAVISGSIMSLKSDNVSDTTIDFLHMISSIYPNSSITIYENSAFRYIKFSYNSVVIFFPFESYETNSDFIFRGSQEIFPLFVELFEIKQPELVIGFGSGPSQIACFSYARERSVPTAFIIHNFQYNDYNVLKYASSVITPSMFAAEYYREALGLNCKVIYNIVNGDRCHCTVFDRKYVTFVNPSQRKGVWAFVKIAEVLGRCRPDILFLVVESVGTERDVVSCGIDLRLYNNVLFTSHTNNPRNFWQFTRICIMPSLWWENQPLTAIEAMSNGIPVIGSDRGGIPETLGRSGIVLPLPERLTGITTILPNDAEIRCWVESIISLWDDSEGYAMASQASLREFERWDTLQIVSQYERHFSALIGSSKSSTSQGLFGSDEMVPLPIEKKHAVILLNESRHSSELNINTEELDYHNINFVYVHDDKKFYKNMNITISELIFKRFESILLLDPCVVPNIYTFRRIFARPEPIITSLDPLADPLDCSILELLPADTLYFGFLRIKISVFAMMINELALPLSSDQSNNAFWDLFSSNVVQLLDGSSIYQGPEEAFLSKVKKLNFCPMLDASIHFHPIGDFSLLERIGSTWDEIPGMFDYAVVYDMIIGEFNGPSIFVEVGTFLGRSICYFADKAKSSSFECKIFAVDTCRGSSSDSTGRLIAPLFGGSFAGTLHKNILSCNLGENIIVMITDSFSASKSFADESLDFCFIDGDHSYNSVFSDLSFWWPKIKPGGVLAGHDYRQAAPWLIWVTKAVHDFFGVLDASHPLCDSCWIMRKPR